jgi:hypothetical protein
MCIRGPTLHCTKNKAGIDALLHHLVYLIITYAPTSVASISTSTKLLLRKHACLILVLRGADSGHVRCEEEHE